LNLSVSKLVKSSKPLPRSNKVYSQHHSPRVYNNRPFDIIVSDRRPVEGVLAYRTAANGLSIVIARGQAILVSIILSGTIFVGREAADLLDASMVAAVGKVPIDRLRHTVLSFPTVSEIYTDPYATI